jgi:hypothetical protein
MGKKRPSGIYGTYRGQISPHWRCSMKLHAIKNEQGEYLSFNGEWSSELTLLCLTSNIDMLLEMNSRVGHSVVNFELKEIRTRKRNAVRSPRNDR